MVEEEEEEEDEDDLADVVVDGENRGGGTHIIGTCVLMCPPSERELRMRKNDIELFERRDPNDRNSSDETLAVKKYTRIVDNVTPDMVRTRDALAMTASYLYGLLDDRPEVPFMVKSKFLWDRLRSVRQICRCKPSPTVSRNGCLNRWRGSRSSPSTNCARRPRRSRTRTGTTAT